MKLPFYTLLEVENLIDMLPEGRVGDFGAGTGRLTIPLLKKGYEVTAVDVSQKSLEKLQHLAKKKNLTGLKTSRKLVHNVNIAGCDVLHHVNIKKYFKIFFKNLQPGQAAVFSEPNGWNLFWYLLIWLKLDWQEEKGVVKINYFNVKKELKAAGFKNIKIIGVGILPGIIGGNIQWWVRLNYALGNLPVIKLFAYRWLIFAAKN